MYCPLSASASTPAEAGGLGINDIEAGLLGSSFLIVYAIVLCDRIWQIAACVKIL